MPLIATQFSLAAGLPLTNAGLLRLDDPETSVAALRVAMSLIMVSMAALATLRQVVLVMAQDPGDHARVRTFVVGISMGLTALMALIASTPVGRFALEAVIGAPPHVAEAALPALQIFVAVPAVMGLRQFYSGLTMHQRRTSLVAAAAIGRLVLMGRPAVHRRARRRACRRLGGSHGAHGQHGQRVRRGLCDWPALCWKGDSVAPFV